MPRCRKRHIQVELSFHPRGGRRRGAGRKRIAPRRQVPHVARPTLDRRHPLHILLLRVHRIPRPVTVKVRDEYHGCRSWVEIDRDLPFEGTPVMADEEFDRARAEIRSVCTPAEPALV